MVGVVAWKDSTSVTILGHGLKVDDAFEISSGVRVSPDVPKLDAKALDEHESLKERAAITTMHEIASFSIVVENTDGGKSLANAAWNHLWDFHLLSLANRSPSFSLYTSSTGKHGTCYAVANRNLIVSALDVVKQTTPDQLEWARENEPKFRALIKDARFGSAMRYFGNAHYLFDLEHRVMLLWAGIEGLLQVDAEHNRRIALYAAMLLGGDAEARWTTFNEVKRAYSLRSRVVHGDKPKAAKVQSGYDEATRLLSGLLARCVELGRVPEREELDKVSTLADFA